MSELIKVGITHGDVNGVGYEILLKTFADDRLLELFTPIIYGSSKSASYHRKVLNDNSVNFNIISRAEEARNDRVNLVNCVTEEIKIELGTASAEAGESAFIALDCATQDLKDNKIDLLVTLPINKDSIQSEQFKFPGHTEFLEERFAENGEKALMIMATDTMKMALVTTHVPLKDVPSALSKELIAEKLRTLNYTLKRDYSIDAPRIAVLSLNPHAGENGLLGSEENEIITPVVKEAQEEWILCAGPFAADGFFGSGRFKFWQCITIRVLFHLKQWLWILELILLPDYRLYALHPIMARHMILQERMKLRKSRFVRQFIWQLMYIVTASCTMRLERILLRRCASIEVEMMRVSI